MPNTSVLRVGILTFPVNYLYDGDGRRVAKANTATPPVPYKLYWYGSGGDILSETEASGNTTAEYIFFGGKRIAMLPAGGTPLYYVEDMLGTSRIITSNTGVVCYDADFYPYGGERPYTNTCPQNNYKFEGKERDTETGNDDFGARYYSNCFGRWLSADWSSVPVPVPYANLSNPQTLNLYAMVADDPESFADLDGHDGIPALPSCAGKAALGPNCTQRNASTTDAQKKEVLTQNQNPDPVQQVIQAMAEKKQQALADVNKPATDEGRTNAAKQATQMAEPMINAGVKVVAVEAGATAIVAVATSATAAEAAHATVQAVRVGAREATAQVLTNGTGVQAARGAYEAIVPGSGRPSTPVEGVSYIVVKVIKNLVGF